MCKCLFLGTRKIGAEADHRLRPVHREGPIRLRETTGTKTFPSSMPHYSLSQLITLREHGLSAELPAPPKKRKNEEFVIQCELIRWWADYCKTVGVPEFLLWHTPNSAVYGGSKENREKIGAMLKRMGQRSGVPDLFLAWPREKFAFAFSSTVHGLFIELKATDGVVSSEQTGMLNLLQNMRYQTAVCRTVEDAKNVIINYLTK